MTCPERQVKKTRVLPEGRMNPVSDSSTVQKNKGLLVALATFRRVHRIFWSFDIRADVGHRETLVLFTGTLRTFPEVLLCCIEFHLLSAIDADILSGAYFLSGFGFLGQFDHHVQLWL